jgi:hypothetical protein
MPCIRLERYGRDGSPRLRDVVEGVSDKYVVGPGYIKLLCPEGEIAFVASPT